MTPCAKTDGGIPPWSPDMSGRIQGTANVALAAGKRHASIPLGAEAHAKLAADGSALISFETADGKVQALDVDLRADGA
jgi:hypothetical protein